MKWLLITNVDNENPGDEFIRIAIEDMIRRADSDATFDLLNKDDPAHYHERPFDRAVWCGSPMFFEDCQDYPWWGALVRGWLFKDRSKILVLGVGDAVGPLPTSSRFAQAVDEVIQKSWALVSRNWIIEDSRIIQSVCPAAFCLLDAKPKERFICNLMEGATHEKNLNPRQSAVWDEKIQDVSDWLKAHGFYFLGHNEPEEQLAMRLGWPEDRILERPATAQGYLDLYSTAKGYIGNRLHGAVVVAGSGGRAWGIGTDSRLKMAALAGARISLPSQWRERDAKDWLANPEVLHNRSNGMLGNEWVRQCRLVKAFAAQEVLEVGSDSA
jgi:hypothetical protein